MSIDFKMRLLYHVLSYHFTLVSTNFFGNSELGVDI